MPTSTAKSDQRHENNKDVLSVARGDNTYLAVMDRKEHHSDVLDKAMDQSHDKLSGRSGNLDPARPPSRYHYCLDDDYARLYDGMHRKIYATRYEEGNDTSALILPLQIDLDRVGLFSKTVTLILGGAGLVFLILMLVFLIPALTGHYQKRPWPRC